MNDEPRLSKAAAVPVGAPVGRVGERVEYVEYVDVEEDDVAGTSIDLRALLATLYRNKWIIAGGLVLGALAGLIIALLTPPTYRATASVQIDQQTARILESEDIEPTPAPQEADRFLQTQVDVLRSRSLAQRVAQNLNLFGNDDFLRAMSAGSAPDPEIDRDSAEWRELVLRSLRENLGVELPRNSRVVRINFESPDPALAARIANSYAENFITSNLQRRFETSAYSRDFLQREIEETRARLEQAERELVAYARNAGLIDASEGIADGRQQGPRSLTTSNLVELNQAYAEARAARVQAQQRWTQAQTTPLMSLPEVLSNPTIQQLTQTRAELQAQYQDEQQRRREEHPAVLQLAARIGEIDDQISRLAGSIRNSIREQYLVAQRQEQALAGNVSQLRGQTLAEQERGVRLNILRRDVDTARQLYEGLLQRYRELSAAAGITNNNISVIDRADAPMEPVAPKPMLNAALGGLGGLGLAFLLVFARERLDDAIRAPDDVNRKLGLPLLGVVPKLRRDVNVLDQVDAEKSELAEAYYAIRTAIELSSVSGLPSSIVITSTKQSEGKSTTAFAVAKAFAATGKRVLLIDADLRKPSQHRLARADNETGLANVLALQSSWSAAIQHTQASGLDLMPAGPLPPNPAQLLGSAGLSDRLASLAGVYDLLIIDAPPVLGLADAPMLAAAADLTVFVVEANRSHRGSAKAAVRRLRSSRASLGGAVLTKFDPVEGGYGYGYGYGSSYYSYGKETSAES